MEARFVAGLSHEKQLYQILGIHSDNMENPSRCAELEKLGGYIALLFPLPISCVGCFHLAYPEGILLDQRYGGEIQRIFTSSEPSILCAAECELIIEHCGFSSIKNKEFQCNRLGSFGAPCKVFG